MRNFYNFIFKYISLLSIIFIFACLVIIFTSIIKSGYKAFFIHYINLNITLTPDINNTNKNTYNYTFNKTVLEALEKISISNNITPVDTTSILSTYFNKELTDFLTKNPDKINTNIHVSLLLTSNADIYYKKYESALNNLNKDTVIFLETAKKIGIISKKFNLPFFTNKDSRYPELAGITGALKGTIITIILTLFFAFIIGVSTSIYIEEYLKKGTARSLLEININNLAAVPSIIFGLLGISIFQNILCIPRSSPLLASIVLTLMILPNIIVYSQIALKSVPRSIKEAAYGIGASKNQVVFKHVFPIALPGIITGLIIGISRALGETAPLLIIGMFIFVANSNFTILGARTTLPTQILMWFNMPEVGFVEKTSAAIIILLTLTISINLLASYIRKSFTKKL